MSMSSFPTTVPSMPLSAVKDTYKYVVVGAGPSGLATASALLNERSYVDPSDHSAGEIGEKVLAEDILLVEKHYAVGGVWRGDGTGHVWPGMRTNLSREKVSFSLLPRDKPPVASTLSNTADDATSAAADPLAPGLATDSHLTEACVEERDRLAEEEEEAERAAAAACNVGYCTAPQGASPSERAGRNTRSRMLSVTNTAEADTGDDDNHDFPTGKAMYRYFVNYAHRSGVKDCILFGTSVLSVRRINDADVKDGKVWELTLDVYPVPNTTEAVRRVVYCEKLIVASGVFSKPFVPIDMVKECEAAGIEYVHSADFRRGEGNGASHLKINGATAPVVASDLKASATTKNEDGTVKKKKYLVIGAAYSGADISVAIEDEGTAEVEILAPRAPKWYVPRYLPAAATAATLATAASAAAALGGQIGDLTAGSSIAGRHAAASRKSIDTQQGEYVTWDRVLESRCGNKHDEHLPYLETRTAAEKHAAMGKVPGIINPGTVDPRLAIDVVKHPMQTVVTTEKFLRYIKDGRIKIVDTPSKEEGGVCAAWLKSRGYDCVLFATGYRCDIEYFDECKNTFDTVLAPCGRQFRSTANNDNDFLPLVLYKATLHPHLNDIAFVGMCRGPYLSTIDVQARWAARVLRGMVAFPDDAKREHYVNIEKKVRETRGRAIMRPVEDGGEASPISPTTGLPAKEYRVELDKHPNSFPHSNYIAFTDSIAEEFGAKPLVSENPDYEGSNVVASMYVAAE